MEEVDNKPTSSESSSRNVEPNSLAETTQENTDIIITPTIDHSSNEASINSSDDNNIVEHETHFQANNLSEIESKSTNANASDDQSIRQEDEHPLNDNSTSTPEEKVQEQDEYLPIAADSEPEALEDTFNRQQDVGSTVTASGGDVDDNHMELSTSSSVTEGLQIDPKDSPRTVLINAPQENLASSSNAEVHVTEQSQHQEPVVEDSEQSLEDIVNILSKKKEDIENILKHVAVDNQMELSASDSETKELENDLKELKAIVSTIKGSDVAVGAVDSPTDAKQIAEKRGIIDTASPFESVKEAVSKFGGIVDWKAHRMVTVERRKHVEQELEKAHDEIPEYRKRSEVAEKEKVEALQELDSTKRLIEELKLNLERAKTEERQAKQDSELAKLRVEEMEQGIAEDSSVAAKAQLEVAKARYTSAITELTSVKEELDALRVEYASLVDEKGEAINKAEVAVAASKQVEKAVEDLTIELIATKESLETAHSAHMEAEEHRIGTVMARDQDFLNWEKELKQQEEELEKLNQKILFSKDLKSKLRKSFTLLLNLKAELNAYMESKSNHKGDEGVTKEKREKKSHNEIQEAIASARKELEEIKLNIEKATSEVSYLKVTATSLRSELEQEKSSLNSMRQREGMASVTVASIEADLDKIKSDITFVHMKEKEGKDTILELPKKLKEADEEANKANSLAQEAREVLRRVQEEAERAKAGAITMNSRLLAAQKEIEAARASERLAIQAIKALQESESARSNNNEVDPSNGVILSVEEYYHLTKQAHDAEEKANVRVATANSEIDIAKENELKTLEKLNEVNKEMAARRESLKIAMGKAEKAREGKLGAEQKLRKWRSEHGQRRKEGEVGQRSVNQNTSHGGKLNPNHSATFPVSYFSSQKSYVHANNENGSPPDARSGKKKKKSFFPRFFMFFGRRKTH
ncbi:protein WEAK CHLOROPLAST MOVEMENT UNDER BLUE LIGHT 1-like [Trifolium pratense]|uniref:protein WEAK CHLOROPLAST MOVEMENT UNDER BLUE LIGHT 1-like n=1 Tax=Trifolium pratense TaxID=57577 RepID=UPI001E690A0C|nr:protein WEAK CHLOROPLAST MOVEMENT UNDER BLUE LIGHT 1-like [Trifolium pratense]XP_045804566.1 protein WEAK CHLOROPLAST MOVEMENT UNDER BLUE LIGHT 1-like [Trifolium pratense]